MDDDNQTQHRQIIPRDQQEAKRTSKSIKNKIQSHQTWTHSSQGAQNSNITRTQGTWRIYQRVRSEEHCLLRLDRAVPNTLTMKQQIHLGYGRNWQKCDTSWTHQELQGWGAHASVQNNDVKTVTSRNDSKKTHSGKWSVRIPEDNNIRWIVGAITTRHTPHKCSRSGHTKFQGALPQYTGRHHTRFSTVIVEQTPTTSRNDNQPVAEVQCNSKRFGIRPYVWPI